MSKKTISLLGCKHCVHVSVDRCGLSGHKIQWHVNAPHQCKDFKWDKIRSASIKENAADGA